MSSGQAYRCTQRTFKHALIGMLEKNYGLLHSRRVLELLAADTQALVEQFNPQPERLAAGCLVFTGTLATTARCRPVSEGDHELVTIAWPLLTPEDIETRANLPTGKAGRRQAGTV